ncbi:MAG: exopolyphosphatase [Bacteroidota bacterium]|jgi:exopolyphosphatase/guanosine-5'-triphosphate,3'-diphosphate pyrophosphatase
MDYIRFGAVDIGSNALRLLLCNVYEGNDGPVFKKAELFRFPLRLGEDSFLMGSISDDSIAILSKVMKSFKLLLEAYEVESYRVCATAAMREASNKDEVIKRVYNYSGLRIEVIDGRTEAELIYSNHLENILGNEKSYMYIDVGGGSTEITLFKEQRAVYSNSFNIGTIRMLHGKVDKLEWSNFKETMLMLGESMDGLEVTAIGSGGNINKIFKLAGRKDDQSLSIRRLKECYDMVSSYNLDERISLLKLNPDRADVIIPAFKIYLASMKYTGIEKIIVPQVGLSDGIVHRLYDDYRKTV